MKVPSSRPPHPVHLVTVFSISLNIPTRMTGCSAAVRAARRDRRRWPGMAGWGWAGSNRRARPKGKFRWDVRPRPTLPHCQIPPGSSFRLTSPSAPGSVPRGEQDLGSAALEEAPRRCPGPRSRWLCSPARAPGYFQLFVLPRPVLPGRVGCD